MLNEPIGNQTLRRVRESSKWVDDNIYTTLSPVSGERKCDFILSLQVQGLQFADVVPPSLS